jgi:hypothetical protein
VVKPLRHSFARVLVLTCLLACVPAVAHGAEASNGGTSPDDPRYAPAKKAKIVNGYAIPPRNAPRRVKRAIDAANEIVDKPYKYGGGHASVEDRGYDCSGSVSYALIGGNLLRSPLASGDFMRWGDRGKGKWITVYANGGHAYMIIAGLRFDTSGRGEEGPRWRLEPRSGRAYVKRHPAGL